MLLAKVILEGPELDLNFFGFVKKGAPADDDQPKYHKMLFEQAFLTLFWLGMVSAGPARRGKGSRTICSLGISDLSCLKRQVPKIKYVFFPLKARIRTQVQDRGCKQWGMTLYIKTFLKCFSIEKGTILNPEVWPRCREEETGHVEVNCRTPGGCTGMYPNSCEYTSLIMFQILRTRSEID